MTEEKRLNSKDMMYEALADITLKGESTRYFSAHKVYNHGWGHAGENSFWSAARFPSRKWPNRKDAITHLEALVKEGRAESVVGDLGTKHWGNVKLYRAKI